MVPTPPPPSAGCSSEIEESKRIDCWPGGGSTESGCIVSSYNSSYKSFQQEKVYTLKLNILEVNKSLFLPSFEYLFFC